MYLKRIRLEGFKSFADKTIFELNQGITAIVGPNGSGKSNIVDAIRWVLGEQSVKQLRGGSQMSDVIFAGSETLAPLNKASVTLTFDNTDHYLKEDFSEVEIKRSVYASGENEYFINNSKVRLKDINDLFIDTNGYDSFSIISQGTITDIVNSKPIERRSVIESAAGVLKYKKRKEESLKKLDKTKENLASINLVIDELKNQVEPLRKQALVATKYLDYKNELKNIEIALITEDITNLNNEYVKMKQKEDELNEKLAQSNVNLNTEEIEKLKLDIYKLDDEISKLNSSLIKITEEISHLDSEKRINIERKKYEYSADAIKNNLINLKEEELNLIKEIEVLNNEIDLLNASIKRKTEENEEEIQEYKTLLVKKDSCTKEIESNEKDKIILENKISILENSISNNDKYPLSVKNILNNDRLRGIHNTIGNLISTTNDYIVALETVLGASSSFLVVDDEECAKDAINYLKEKNIGRATFLPLNIIKSRYIDSNIIERIKNVFGYVGILSDLVTYDKKYQSIIENQLGNVIVVKNIDNMNLIAKILDYKYRVVTLDGSIIYAGGSISGGKGKTNSSINTRLELEESNTKLLNINNKLDSLKEDLKNLNSDVTILEDKINNEKNNLIEMNTLKSSKLTYLDNLENKLKNIKNDLNGLNNIENNTLDKELESIMDKWNTLTIEKEKMEQKMNHLKDEKNDLNNKLNDLELASSKASSINRSIQAELNTVSVNVGKLNVKLDNLLLSLNEDYSMSYEYAKSNFELDMDIDVARGRVAKLKSDIKSLGEVNTGSIEEFNRVNTRYEFLVSQANDLEVSVTSLLDIISDMDNIMIDKFKNTFNKVANEFSKVFKIMFQGGSGSLELTMPDDYLNTGVEIKAVPPGKKLPTTQSLSGGEKSLTAICLLFAILNVSPIPFIVFDEVEAALDETNVDLFGEYLNKKKMDSQYILITHKKRMMEYADVLYGITMQNAGVSKVVSVELENI